jgi:hypothetical protein
MIFISDIPHLKVYKQKTFLPRDEKISNMYSVVFINNNSFQDALNLIQNEYLYHNNKYHFYFMDYEYRGKLFNRSYRFMLRKERSLLYDKLESTIKDISPIIQFELLNDRNFYFDLAQYNTIYFNLAKRSNYELKVKWYIDFLNRIINAKRLDNYKNKIICIDINSWMTNVRESLSGRPNFNNPIYIIYYAMKKYFEKF